jgi:glycosyltransferase involved in cell wall biosynthesis
VTAPRFTVVIPAYQAEATLADAVESVLVQSAADLDLLIVDDGSTDATSAVANEYRSDPRVTVIRQANSGLAASRNAGIARAQTEFVAFLDADDLWMPRFLEVTGSLLEANPDAGFAYADGWAFDDVARRVRRASVMARQRPPTPPPDNAEDFLLELVERNFILAEATVRRSALDSTGPFDESLPAVEDYDLWLRMVSAGFRGVSTPELLLIRRDRPDSMSKDFVLMWQMHIRAWQSLAKRPDVSDRVRAAARRKIEATERLLAADAGRSSYPLRYRVRGVLGTIKRRSLGDRLYFPEPPAEVRSAFPRLFEG